MTEESRNYICNLIISISIFDDFEVEIIKELKYSEDKSNI